MNRIFFSVRQKSPRNTAGMKHGWRQERPRIFLDVYYFSIREAKARVAICSMMGLKGMVVIIIIDTEYIDNFLDECVLSL